MTIDLTQVALAFLGLASALVSAAIPFVVPLLRQRLHVSITADQATALERALQAGAGEAYRYALSKVGDGGLANVNVQSTALAVGARYVTSKLPETLDNLGVTPDQVHSMVAARLGGLLAADPTVTAASPPPRA